MDADTEEPAGFVREVFDRDNLLVELKRFIAVSNFGLKPRLDISFIYDAFSLMVSPMFMVYLQRIDHSGDANTDVRELMKIRAVAPYSMIVDYVIDSSPPLYFIILGYKNPHTLKYFKKKNLPLAPYYDIVEEIKLKKEKFKKLLKKLDENIYIPLLNGLSFYTLPLKEE